MRFIETIQTLIGASLNNPTHTEAAVFSGWLMNRLQFLSE